MPQPHYLTAGPDAVIAAIVVLITIISGIVNFVKERSAAARAQQDLAGKRAQTRDERLKSEIEAFLEEVGSSPKPQRPAKAPVVDLSADDLVEAGPVRPSKPQQRPPQRKKAPARRSVAERHLEEAAIGQVRQRHVTSQVQGQHLQSTVAQTHLTPAVASTSTNEISSTQATPPAAAFIAAMVSSPDQLRNVILLNEILSPPISRRRRPS